MREPDKKEMLFYMRAIDIPYTISIRSPGIESKRLNTDARWLTQRLLLPAKTIHYVKTVANSVCMKYKKIRVFCCCIKNIGAISSEGKQFTLRFRLQSHIRTGDNRGSRIFCKALHEKMVCMGNIDGCT